MLTDTTVYRIVAVLLSLAIGAIYAWIRRDFLTEPREPELREFARRLRTGEHYEGSGVVLVGEDAAE